MTNPDRELTDAELEFLVPWSLRRYPTKLRRRIQGLPRIPEARWQHGIPAKDRERFRLIFESANSDWLQGVALYSDFGVYVDEVFYRKGVTVLWEKDGSEYVVDCLTKEGVIWVWNVWDYRPQGARAIMSQRMYSGMIVDVLPTGFRYRCNEGRDDDDYDDLVFRIERTSSLRPGSSEPARRERAGR